MRSIYALIGACMFMQVTGSAQEDERANRYEKSITVEDLRSRLEIIAADSMEGRETGRVGQRRAANYIASQFNEFGLSSVMEDGSFYQPYIINVTYPDTVELLMGTDTFRFLKDLYHFNLSDMSLEMSKVTYLGYGIHSENYSDYGDMDVRDKVLMVSSSEPREKEKSLIDVGEYSTEWTTDWRRKIVEAEMRGAKALLVIDDRFSTSLVKLNKYINRPDLDVSNRKKELRMPVVFVSSALADRILKESGIRKGHRWLEKQIAKKKTTLHLDMDVEMTLRVNRNKEKLTAENVLGLVEGSDKRNEYVIVSCHYDHLGKKGDDIYNGADDDGSGTTSMLELAEAFALAKQEGYGPKRSILFIAFSGEEKGLLGSEFYSDNPVISLKETMVDLNIDMVGRVDERHAPDSNYVYLIGADKISQNLHDLSEKVNATTTNLELDYTYNDERDPNRFYYRSDHYNFAKNGIPVIFYFTGLHEDYHKPTDTVDKIMFPKMQRIVHLVFQTAWELSNREEGLR